MPGFPESALRSLELAGRVLAGLPEQHEDERFAPELEEHPFDARNLHSGLPGVVRTLFDSGHFAQATFEAAKFLENQIKRLAQSTKIGKDLMMQTFNETSPVLALTALTNVSERDEQEGFKYIFAGVMMAIRNPRGHELFADQLETCLDHLSLISLLLRRLDQAGHAVV